MGAPVGERLFLGKQGRLTGLAGGTIIGFDIDNGPFGPENSGG